MSLIHIKKIQKQDPKEGLQELFAITAVGIATPQGKKLIPNPAGTEALLFETLEAAEAAARYAGFDYEYEGQTTRIFGGPPSGKPLASGNNLSAAVPTLIQRLRDREPSVVTHSAFALGALRAHEALEPLIAILGHDDASVRKSVSEALAKLGASAVISLKASYEKAQKSNQVSAPYIRLTVMSTLLEMTQIGQGIIVLEQCLPLVLSGLDDESWLVRAQAALVIGQVAAFKESLERT